MFFSLAQTLLCVLLINGSLYALHLTGGGIGGGNGGGGTSSGSLAAIGSSDGGGDGSLRKSSALESNAGRLSEELADMAQLERERLMLLGLAKQTADGGTGHHGRPIITGRIQMTPVEEAESDYPALLLQQQQQHQHLQHQHQQHQQLQQHQQQQQAGSRSYLFGSVVKHPTFSEDEEGVGGDYGTSEDYDGGGLDRRRPVKYEYGRLVEPSEHAFEPQHMDLDAFMELESEPDVEEDDMIPDLDGYQYLDELLAEQNNRGWEEQSPYGGAGSLYHGHHNGRPQNPYQTLEELEANPPQALQELFAKEHHDAAVKKHHQQQQLQQQQQQQQLQQQQQQQAIKTRNAFNMRAAQKWQRKRAQQPATQQVFPRNIFAQQKQPHHFGLQQHSKLSLSGSEATAVAGKQHATKSSISGAEKSSSSPTSDVAVSASTSSGSSTAHQNQNAEQNKLTGKQQSPPTDSQTTAAQSQGGGSRQSQEQQLLHSNRKRSGAAGLMPSMGIGGVGFGGMQSPLTHSIASQLMLRPARGQRQYDVPQIECPTAMDGMERFACPTPDLQGRFRCIDDHVLCDGFIDCPEGEDEDRRSCMFYKTTKAHLDVLADALLRWARGR